MDRQVAEAGYYEARERARLEAHCQLLRTLARDAEGGDSITVWLVPHPLAEVPLVAEPATLAS